MRRNLESELPDLRKLTKACGVCSLDHAVRHDDVGTMSAAFVGFERRDAETHRRAVLLGRGRRDRNRHERERRSQR